VIIDERYRKLMQIDRAVGSAGGLARRLNRRQQQTYQNANNGNDDQQLDEGEAGAAVDLARAAWPPDRQPHAGTAVAK
jgi:hypothetical protein